MAQFKEFIDTSKNKGTALDAFEKSKAIKVNLMDLDKVHPNGLNPFEMSNIEELADNIKQFGLMQNVDAFTSDPDSDEVLLLSGHRRLKALQLLVERGDQYTYNGMDITGKIPVAKQKYIVDGSMRMLAMIAANNHRDMTNDEKNRIIEKTEETLQSLEKRKKWKQESGRRAHTIASFTGIAEHYVKTYFAGKNKTAALIAANEAESDQEKPAKDQRSDEIHEQIKQYKKIMSCLKKAQEQLNGIDQAFLNDLEKDEAKEMNNLLTQVSKLTATTRGNLLGKY